MARKAFIGSCLALLLICSAGWAKSPKKEDKKKVETKTEIVFDRLDYLELQFIDKQVLQLQLQFQRMSNMFDQKKREYREKVEELKRKYKVPDDWEFTAESDKFIKPKGEGKK